MQSVEPSVEAAVSKPVAKPGSARGKKTTPRSRAKKKTSFDDKKPATRRRASPRHRERHSVKEKESKETVKEEDQPTVKEKKEEIETKLDTQQEVASEELLPPSQDQELRRSFLQRIYRQLQSTHPNQDDAVIRQIATNLEMEICRKSTSRNGYVAALDQEIHKLMQFEMAQEKAPTHGNETQSFEEVLGNNQVQTAVSSGMHREDTQAQMTQSRHYEYAQALAKAQADGGPSMMSTPDQPMSDGDGSFVQSLMASQSAYGRGSMQQQQQQQEASAQGTYMSMGNQYYPTSSGVSTTSHNYSMQSNIGDMTGQSTPRNMMEAQQQLGNFQVQQYSQQPSSMRSQQGSSTLQDFTAQVQHFDKSVLIELLWNQRNLLAQWQRRANQLEMQLAGHRSTTNNMRSPGLHSSYSSPLASGSPFVSPNIASEAEIQRARERNNARITHQQPMPQYTYGQQHSESNDVFSRNGSAGSTWGTNPQIYWEKIRALKAAHSGQLLIAHRALAHHNAPPNSTHSLKAQSVKNNIMLVLNILNEPPKAIQPRSFDVLTSIERFIQATVIPIVRKVQSSGLLSPMTAGSQIMVSRGVATTAATYAPGVPPPVQESPAGMASTYNAGAENQYPGPRWTSPSAQFSSSESVRQSNSTDVMSTARETEEGADNPGMAAPERLVDEMSSAENCQSHRAPVEYTPINSERGDTIAVIQMEACQADGGAGRSSTYEASIIASDDSPGSTIPVSETRPSTRTEARLSPGINSSFDGSASKMMDAPSVEDSLNDFSDFPELDFDDPLQSSNFVKENNPSNGAKKRGVEEI